MKAFLLAAGFGTRLQPFTNEHPKALAMVNGKSLLERNILFLQGKGIFDVVVNVHHFPEQIIQTLETNKGFGSRFAVSEEEDILETGGGLKQATALLRGEEPILMMNVDILCEFDLNQLLEKHLKSQSIATLAVQKRNSSRVLLFDNSLRLSGWKNFKTNETKLPINEHNDELSEYAFSGIQIIAQRFFDKIPQSGKFSIIDTYLSLCKDEKISGWNHTGDLWLDVGKPETLAKAAELF